MSDKFFHHLDKQVKEKLTDKFGNDHSFDLPTSNQKDLVSYFTEILQLDPDFNFSVPVKYPKTRENTIKYEMTPKIIKIGNESPLIILEADPIEMIDSNDRVQRISKG